MKPRLDNVLVQPLEKSNKTESGLFLPDTNSLSAFREGKVVAAGDGNWQMGVFVDVELYEGDVVVWPAHAGTPYEDKVLLKAADIVGIKKTEV